MLNVKTGYQVIHSLKINLWHTEVNTIYMRHFILLLTLIVKNRQPKPSFVRSWHYMIFIFKYYDRIAILLVDM